MTTYTSKNGHLGATDEVSGGYSHELTYPSNAKIRNAELKLVLVDCLEMTKRIAELENKLAKYSRADLVWLTRNEVKGLTGNNQGGVICLDLLRLEQQARGIKDILNIFDGKPLVSTLSLDVYANQLLKQAKQLKGGDL